MRTVYWLSHFEQGDPDPVVTRHPLRLSERVDTRPTLEERCESGL